MMTDAELIAAARKLETELFEWSTAESVADPSARPETYDEGLGRRSREEVRQRFEDDRTRGEANQTNRDAHLQNVKATYRERFHDRALELYAEFEGRGITLPDMRQKIKDGDHPAIMPQLSQDFALLAKLLEGRVKPS